MCLPLFLRQISILISKSLIKNALLFRSSLGPYNEAHIRKWKPAYNATSTNKVKKDSSFLNDFPITAGKGAHGYT